MAHIHDIAIFHLSSDLKLGGKQAKAVSLPVFESDPAVGEQVLIAGWGLTFENDPTFPNDLMRVSVPIVSRSSCQSVYFLLMGITITNNQICAGFSEGGKSACQV
jgi:trypsin